jgi:hypothetical protein
MYRNVGNRNVGNASLIDEGQNCFERAPRQTSTSTPGQYAWRLAPRLGAAIGAWEGSALMSRSSWASARRALAPPLPRRMPRSLQAVRTTRGTGWRCRRAPS